MVKISKMLCWLLILGIFLFIIIFPFYWMLISSSKNFFEIASSRPVFWPEQLTLEAYKEVLFKHHFVRYFINSLFVASGSACLATAIGVIGAYALARLRFKGKTFLSRAILLVYMFPAVLLLLPLFSIMSRLHLTNSLSGLVLVYLAQTLPVSLYMLGNYFRSIPPELEEAGMVDGASRLKVIRHITLPLSLPAIATVMLYSFVIAWNEFLFAFVFLNDPDKFTLSPGLRYIYASYHTPWDKVMAASTIIALPVMLLFILFQSYLVKGLTAGGVKGA